MDASFLLLPESAPRSFAATRRRMPPEGLSAVEETPSMQIRRFAAREAVFLAGDAVTHVHEVAQGAVMISRRLPDGRRQIVDIVGPGRLFGFAGDRVHDCTAEALMPSIVCGLDRASGERNPQIAARLVQAMSAEIGRLRDLTLLLGRKTALERVATFFVSMVGDAHAESATIALPVTRTEIADHLGLTIETVSRNVTKLKKMALIGDDRGDEITIHDVRGLRAVAVGGDCAR